MGTVFVVHLGKMKLERTLLALTLLALSAHTGLGRQVRPALPKQTGQGRIVGGTEAEDGEFPWQVSLRQIGIIGATHFCGGSIVNENWVVTAGHCCSGSTTFMHVVAGGIKLNANEGEEERRDVQKIIVHPDYSSSDLSNDICLLQLATPLEMTEFIQPVVMPEPKQETPADTEIIVTGWGSLSEGGLSLPNVLHKVTIPVIADEKCNEAYSSSGYSIIDSMLCAGLPEGGKDSCQGDSGGPLIEAQSKTLLGVVSWGIGCARPGLPGVYTQVSYYVDWIQETMNAN